MSGNKCDNYEVCEKYDCIYGVCEDKNPNEIHITNYCSPSAQTLITILSSIDDKLAKLLEK